MLRNLLNNVLINICAYYYLCRLTRKYICTPRYREAKTFILNVKQRKNPNYFL